MAIQASIYITNTSIVDSLEATTWPAFEKTLSRLKTVLSDFERSENILVECPNDVQYYGKPGSSIDDKLFDIALDNWDQYQLYLNHVTQAFLPYIKFNNTQALLALVNNQDDRFLQEEHFPRHYLLTLQSSTRIQGIADCYHVSSWSETLSANSQYIASNHENSQEFISWSKNNYENLDFHSDVEQTLHTIQVGPYTDYKALLSHSLDTLNQAYYAVSDNPAHNQQDLNTISNLTGVVGLKRNLDCTRQGSNKPEWEFKTPPKVTSKTTEDIKCEYHLKIDVKDNGTPIPRGKGNPVRVYFGLKSYEEYDRKQFKIAHLGKHL